MVFRNESIIIYKLGRTGVDAGLNALVLAAGNDER
jgi:hypothetical protein